MFIAAISSSINHDDQGGILSVRLFRKARQKKQGCKRQKFPVVDRPFNMFRNVSPCGGSSVPPLCPVISISGSLAIHSGIAGNPVFEGMKSGEAGVSIYEVQDGLIVHNQMARTQQEPVYLPFDGHNRSIEPFADRFQPADFDPVGFCGVEPVSYGTVALVWLTMLAPLGKVISLPTAGTAFRITIETAHQAGKEAAA